MNRTLVTILAAAAVVGATGGTLAAARLGSDAARTPATSPDLSPDQADGTESGGGVLWANSRVLRDSGTEVRISLDGDPVALERADVGWVVSTSDGPDIYDTSVVRRDGSVEPLVQGWGDGDVSPDGTRYVTLTEDDSVFVVLDIATGRVSDEIAARAPGETALGSAQFVDDDTVATTWRTRGGQDVVLVGDLGSDERTVASTDVASPWAISPDGRWIAGISFTGRDAETGYRLCALLAPTDRSDEGVTDCGSTYVGEPRFSADSRDVIAYSATSYTDVRLLPTDDGRIGGATMPGDTFEAGFVGDDLVTLGPANDEGDGTVVRRCRIDQDCEVVDEFGDPAAGAVLGAGP